MKASELIGVLQTLMQQTGTDPEVLGQSHGCCRHGHEIESVVLGSEKYKDVYTGNEIGMIVIRV